MDKTGMLKNTALFSGFGDKELSRLLDTAKERSFATGDVIIKEDYPGGRGFYVLLEGAAEVRKGSHLLATYAPGDYFGEMALLLDDTPRTAQVTATEPSTYLAITQWDLKALIGSHPEMGVAMMAVLAKRLRDTDQALAD